MNWFDKIKSHRVIVYLGAVATLVGLLVTFRDNLCSLYHVSYLCDAPECSRMRERGIALPGEQGWERPPEPKGQTDSVSPDLWSHFAEQPDNAKLLSRLNRLLTDQSGLKRSTVTFVAGSAGIGKSFFLRRFWKRYPDDVHRIKLSEIPKNFLEQVPDLQIDPLPNYRFDPLSYMPSIKELGSVSLEKLFKMFDYDLNVRKHRVLLIDDLDEVSQPSADYILRLVLDYRDVYLKANTNESRSLPLHFVVVGRPEAFAPTYHLYYRKHKPIPDPFPLRLRTYRSSAEIGMFYDNYMKFVCPSYLKETGAERRDDVIWLIESHSYLKDSLRQLDLANRTIEAILSQLKAEGDVSEINHTTIKKSLVSRLESRAKAKHFRPTTTQPYRHLIEDIAAEKWSEVASDGFFLVAESDVESIRIGDAVGRVRIEDALNRSGLATLDPADATERRYTFRPRWLHRYYVERHNERVRDELLDHGCTVPGHLEPSE